jgi:hypothetical protein
MIAITPELPKDPSIFDNDETPPDARILIVSLIEKYLETTADAIITKNGKTLVAFSLKEIPFVFEYDIITNTLIRGYFQDL